MSRSEYDANRYLAAPSGLSCTRWNRKPVRVANAHPGLWVALFCSVVLALAFAL